ncbi:hypothetical protein L873DRAFT_1289078 [Choiromyces venosus 120613-1]|uniref:F-box domain-containing protein n=1 Tax=Choiromyces venosus 120613-1 TaxID=1336337 RepID=A0A3N4JES2_9PEZI|nr:hypothetical protein L873DRAFT_1289078 [Choiromyces venosus 120613-1]
MDTSVKTSVSSYMKGNINAEMLRLPELVLQHIFGYLETPAPIRKLRRQYLHGFFESHRIIESDPRDLFNLICSCRTIYKAYKEMRRSDQILDQFYIEIPRPPRLEPQLVRIIGPGKLQTFVANPKRQRSSELYRQKLPQASWVVRSRLAGLEQLDEDRDALGDILGQHCVKWVSTFISWPVFSDGEQSFPHDPATQQLVDFRQNFLGVLNFHQYENPSRFMDNEGQPGSFGHVGFWAMICHCRMGKFLVLHSSSGSIWERNIPCPRIALVTDSYPDARRTYEQALASAYFEAEASQGG